MKVPKIIKYTSKKYYNIDTNICLQLGLISSCKLESMGICGITLACLDCRYSNHTRPMVRFEKSNIYQYFNILYELGHNYFWEEVSVKTLSLGLVIVCLSLVP